MQTHWLPPTAIIIPISSILKINMLIKRKISENTDRYNKNSGEDFNPSGNAKEKVPDRKNCSRRDSNRKKNIPIENKAE